MSLIPDLLAVVASFLPLQDVIKQRRTSKRWLRALTPVAKARLGEWRYRLLIFYSIERPISVAYISIGQWPTFGVVDKADMVSLQKGGPLDDGWWDRLVKKEIRLAWSNTAEPPYLNIDVDDGGDIPALLLPSESLPLLGSGETEHRKRSRDDYEYTDYPDIDDISSDV